MKSFLVGLYVLICLVLGITFVKCDCTVHAKEGSHSQFHLNRLDPLKGKTFEFTEKDGDDQDLFLYKFSVCSELIQGTNAGITQQYLQETNRLPVTVGRINDTVVKSGTDWIMLTYKGGKSYRHHCNFAQRQAHIMILCNKNTLADNFTIIYEESNGERAADCYYLMEMESSVACSSTNANQGLSGSILLIVWMGSVHGIRRLFNSV